MTDPELAAALREFAGLFHRAGLETPNEIGTADQCEATCIEAAARLAALAAITEERP